MNQFGRLPIIVAAFALAACGSAATAAGSSSSPSPSRGPVGALRGGSAGQLVQINGQTLILSGASGDITVSFTPTTTITKTSTAALADITPGVCIVATGAKDASGLVTANTVRITPKSSTGACRAGGFTGGARATPRPSFSPRPTPSGQANLGLVSGQVTAASGVSITVMTLAGTSQTITVPTTAAVTISSVTTAAALQVGQCLRAIGPPDSAGTVQATALTITPPGPSGTCTTGFGGSGFGRRSSTGSGG